MSKVLLAEYAKNCTELLELARSIGAEDLVKSPTESQWSAAFVIHHMADADAHFATRFLQILTADKPAIAPFDEEIYPARLKYAERNASDSLLAISGLQAVVANILSLVSDSDWLRVGIHAEKGEVTLSDILTLTNNHVVAHTGQLRQIINSF